MASFVLLGPGPRSFHQYGDLNPGDQIEADENPDPNWFTPAKSEKPAKAATTSEKE